MPEKNKYHYDLKNVHYALGTKTEDGVITYATPKRLRGAISMDISAEGEPTKVRADGIDYITVVSNNGYSGSITMVMVPDDFKTDCLAEQTDVTNKIQYEDAQTEPAPFALLFEFTGDKKSKRHVLYNCTASRPSLKGENKDNQKEPDTEDLEITSSPALLIVNGEERTVVKSSTTMETEPAVYDAWYKEVIIPGKAPAAKVEGEGA